jgi:putative transcriptional regulator
MHCLWQRAVVDIMEITTEGRRFSMMLGSNIKSIRKSKGLSQEQLAVKLNVVRQTVSKWECGLSVPDSEMLISISEVLETPVSTLLGETVAEAPVDDLKVISENLEIINLQLARNKATKRKILHWLFIVLCVLILITAAVLISQKSPYLSWDFNDPETAVAGTFFHVFEWVFFRLTPIALIGTIVGIILTREKRH